MVVAVAGVVFVLMFMAFRSVVVAIKAVISIAVTQLIVRQTQPWDGHLLSFCPKPDPARMWG